MKCLLSRYAEMFQIRQRRQITVQISGHDATGDFENDLRQIKPIMIVSILESAVRIVRTVPVFQLRYLHLLGDVGISRSTNHILNFFIVVIPYSVAFIIVITVGPGQAVCSQGKNAQWVGLDDGRECIVASSGCTLYHSLGNLDGGLQ